MTASLLTSGVLLIALGVRENSWLGVALCIAGGVLLGVYEAVRE